MFHSGRERENQVEYKKFSIPIGESVGNKKVVAKESHHF
jgi:hypothetical protein